MPDAVAADPALEELPLADPGTPEAGEATSARAEAVREEGGYVYWTLALAGLFLVISGWLLPWFTNKILDVHQSPEDVVSSSPSGAGAVSVYLMGACMVLLTAAALYDAVCVRWGRGRPYRWMRVRAVVALAGAAAVLVALLITINNAEPVFGSDAAAIFARNGKIVIDNAVWMSLSGYLIVAYATGLRGLVIRHAGIAFAIAAFAFGGAFPLIFGASVDFIFWGATQAGVFILLSVGLNVVVGFAGLLDLGYAAFFAIGAYACASIAGGTHGIHVPFYLVIFVGAALAASFGAILGAPTLRLRGDYLAIVTLGFGEIVPEAAKNNLFGATGGPNGLGSIDQASLPVVGSFGIAGQHPSPYFWTILVLIGLVIMALHNLERSRLGRAWVAVREDEVAAAATGVNTVTTKLLAFAIGASVSGFAGAFFGAELSGVTPESFDFAVSVTALTAVVLGGIGNLTGAVVGGVLIAFINYWMLGKLQEWMQTLSITFGAPPPGATGLGAIDYSKYKYVVYGVILIGIMLVRPSGLISNRARRVELATGAESEALAAVRGAA